MSRNAIGGWSRRGFLRASAALGAAGLASPVFAQSGTFDVPEGLPAPDGPLRWLDSGDTKGIFHADYFTRYGEEAGIDVVYDGLPWQEIGTVLPLGIRNGSAPDAFTLPLGMEPSVAVAEGWLQPIEQYIPDFEAWQAGFPEGSFVEGINVFDGLVYGFPYSTERRFNNALLFNRAKMEEVGYGHIGPNRALTFDEMRDAAAKITATGMPGFIIGGKQVGRWADRRHLRA